MLMKHLGLLRAMIYLVLGVLGTMYKFEPMPVFPIMVLAGVAELYCYKKEVLDVSK